MLRDFCLFSISNDGCAPLCSQVRLTQQELEEMLTPSISMTVRSFKIYSRNNEVAMLSKTNYAYSTFSSISPPNTTCGTRTSFRVRHEGGGVIPGGFFIPLGGVTRRGIGLLYLRVTLQYYDEDTMRLQYIK